MSIEERVNGFLADLTLLQGRYGVVLVASESRQELNDPQNPQGKTVITTLSVKPAVIENWQRDVSGNE